MWGPLDKFEVVVRLLHRFIKFYILQRAKSSNLANKNKEVVGVALRFLNTSSIVY
jgi:hypothetical protein